MKKIEFFLHNINNDDLLRLNKVVKSIFLTTGTEVALFEQAFSKYLGIKQTVGVTSCTAALHLSLLALGIGNGDEVITTPMSFCATANAILHAGAKPVFVDVEEDTGNMNAELIEAAITEKTKAILPVHLYGQMCDMEKIHEIASRYNLKIVEDAAHSIEASRAGLKPGQISDAACFSFYATKNITSGEGGAISTNNISLAEGLRILRLHGIDKSAADRYTEKYRHWDMPILGWKYNMDNIQASLLLGQLRRIDKLWEKRNQLWEYYETLLKTIKEIELLKTLPGLKHARHLFTILVPAKRRDQILWSLQKNNIGVAVNYRPIHLLKYYRKSYGFKEGDFPVAEEIGKRTISLPLYPKLKKSQILYIVNVLKKIFAKNKRY
ncbi:MAG: DegT/DnrJ/EryC1/StrS family aminotransferase [Nitrospirae bacterium]|jgi:UDP-4-amino-4-deoxy-L-arabinose-oxoglutarate aminotransferase|nr:DegT/DnrJ/EryC1/StrS family aminotransferase [Nitrospirota bacterium]